MFCLCLWLILAKVEKYEFKTEIFKQFKEAYLKYCEMLTRNIQNPAIEHYSAIFRHIQNHVQPLHTLKPGILGILENPELFHNDIPTHIQNPVILRKIYEYSELLTYLKSDTYSEPSQRLKIEFFAKIVKKYNYFPKALHLRSLTGF